VVIPQGLVQRSLDGEAGLARRIGRVFVLLTPLTALPPIEVGRFQGRGPTATVDGSGRFVPFPGVWNLTGHPAMSLPAGWTPDGVPLAAQLVGRWEDEATLVSLAAQLEAERRWTDRRPPIS
jgi:amidase